MRIWNSLFIILFYLVLVKLSLSSASTALPRCLFLILQISCVSSCSFTCRLLCTLQLLIHPSIPLVLLLFFLHPRPLCSRDPTLLLWSVTSRYKQTQGLTFLLLEE